MIRPWTSSYRRICAWRGRLANSILYAITGFAPEALPPSPPSDAPPSYIVYKFEELGDIRVVVVFDPTARAEVKLRFDGHSLWFAKEFKHFLDLHATHRAILSASNIHDEASIAIGELMSMFLGVCHCKSAFGASLVATGPLLDSPEFSEPFAGGCVKRS